MSLFVSNALADDTNAVIVPKADTAPVTATTAQVAASDTPIAQEPNPILGIMPLLLIAVVFYALMIRPQQKKYKEHQELVNSVARGDRVVTSGGLIGKVSKVDNDIVHVEIADAVTVQIARNAISHVTDKHGTAKKSDIKDAAQAVVTEVEKARKSGKKTKVANDN